MKILIVVLVLLAVFFGFPILNNVSLPASFSPDDLGDFIKAALNYWQSLFTNVTS